MNHNQNENERRRGNSITFPDMKKDKKNLPNGHTHKSRLRIIDCPNTWPTKWMISYGWKNRWFSLLDSDPIYLRVVYFGASFLSLLLWAKRAKLLKFCVKLHRQVLNFNHHLDVQSWKSKVGNSSDTTAGKPNLATTFLKVYPLVISVKKKDFLEWFQALFRCPK